MIKNLKLYCKKERFKKVKLKALPFLVSLALLLPGCSLTKEETNTPPTYTQIEQTQEDYSNINDMKHQEIKLDDQTLAILEQDISLKESENQNFQNYLMDIHPEYEHSSLFSTGEALNRYHSLSEYQVTSSNVIQNNVVNVEVLYNLVLKNNEEFLKQGNNQNIYKDLGNSKVKEICNIVANQINQLLKENNHIDQNEVDSNLKNLKVLATDSFLNASITKEGCLTVNLKSIETLSTKATDAFERTIRHEAVHLVQRNCEEEKQNESYESHIGPCYKWEDLKTNPLYYDWFLESSAEQITSSTVEKEPLVYANEISYLDSLNVATSLDEKIDKIEDVTIEKDLDKLFDIFANQGVISQEEMIQMMYSINFITMESPDLLARYEQEYGSMMKTSEISQLKQSYSSSVYQTLTKKFYSDLGNKITNQTISLKDAFALISLFENDASNHLWYADISRIENNRSFIEIYVDIQDNFFEMIAKQLNISVEEIKESYNAYNRNMNFEINELAKDPEFLKKVSEKIQHNKSIGVNEVYTGLQQVKSH